MISVQVAHNQLHLRRLWLCWLLVCVLFRAIIPTGFMPGAGGGSDLYSWITLCYGNQDSAQLIALAEHHHGHHAHHGEHAEEHLSRSVPEPAPEDHVHGSPDHAYCLFAGITFNGTAPAEEQELYLSRSARLSHIAAPVHFPEPLFPPQLPRAPPVSSHRFS
jgi:hypothetical protein